MTFSAPEVLHPDVWKLGAGLVEIADSEAISSP
jgi:hypothetical protein